MPEIVVKITNDDGTEQTFGPVSVSNKAAADVSEILSAPEANRLQQLEAERAEQGRAEASARSAQAEAANRLREERGQQGLDPDGAD